MKRVIFQVAAIACLAISASAVHAHVVLDVKSAEAGSYYRGALRVGHGCNGSPVNQLVVTIPAGVQGAKPMPKPGWRIDIERKPLAKPYNSHGRVVTEDVSEIRWTANTPADALPDVHYDEFVIMAKLPETAGRIYWRVSQICEQGRIDWHDAGVAQSKTPAAVLDINAPMPAVHQHQH